MASKEELLNLFAEGALGKLLAKTFKGERGKVYPNEDLDFIVVFPSDGETPKIELISEVVTRFYTSHGYKVEIQEKSGNSCYEAIVSHDRAETKNVACVGVVITTNYPWTPGNHASIRVTTTVLYAE